MKLKAIYDTQDEIPEAHRELYTERDGKWELTGIEGVRTQADVDRVQEALRKEKKDHKDNLEKLKAFDGVDLEQVEKDREELEALRVKVEAGAGEGFDEEKFNAAVEKAAQSKAATITAPLKRDLDKAAKERDELRAANEGLTREKTMRTVTDAVRKAASTGKVIDTAMDDVLMLAERVFEVHEDGTVLTRDEVGVTPGVAPDVWLSEMQDRRPHWWPAAEGGGAKGGNKTGGFANNPFSREHWNLTAQGAAVRADRAKAERMAAAAGTKIGGGMPVAKPAA